MIFRRVDGVDHEVDEGCGLCRVLARRGDRPVHGRLQRVGLGVTGLGQLEQHEVLAARGLETGDLGVVVGRSAAVFVATPDALMPPANCSTSVEAGASPPDFWRSMLKFHMSTSACGSRVTLPSASKTLPPRSEPST